MSALRFCKQCNNLMYPKESKAERTLVFICKSCGSTEKATHNMENVVYRNNLKPRMETKLDSIDPAVIHDPTLPRTKKIACPRCAHNEAVFFQADSGRDAKMNLVFVCVACQNKWLNINKN